MLRFFVTFVALLAVLFGAELTPWAQQYFVVPWTDALAAISAWLVTVFDPGVAATGNVLRSTVNGFAVVDRGGLQRRRGDDRARRGDARVSGAVAKEAHRASPPASSPCRALNVVRVISLFYLGQWNMRVFEWAHLYVWQALIMLDVLVVWLVWVRLLPRDRRLERPAGRTAGRIDGAGVGLSR